MQTISITSNTKSKIRACLLVIITPQNQNTHNMDMNNQRSTIRKQAIITTIKITNREKLKMDQYTLTALNKHDCYKIAEYIYDIKPLYMHTQ